MTTQEIVIPPEVGSESADAIRSHIERLHAAQARDDLSDVVGCAKELAESVAKVVLAARGGVVGDNTAFKSLIAEAHKAVERQPGEGIATDPAIRKMAQSAKGIVEELGELRNSYGTGHGRATTPPVLEEHAELATDAVAVWARWVLRRLPAFMHSDVNDLIQMLQGGTFYRGTLASRLDAIDLHSISAQEAHALGAAIGRRTVGETFMVRMEGVDPVLAQPGLFPKALRSGLIFGLLFDENGALSTTTTGVGLAVNLLLVDDELSARLDEILPAIADASWITPYKSPGFETVATSARTAASRFPAEFRHNWASAWYR